METHPESRMDGLLDLCRKGVDRAKAMGADAAEVSGTWEHAVEAKVQQNDLDGLSNAEETTLGVRVLVDGRPGFASANSPRLLEQAVEDAIAIAKATAPDPWAGFAAAHGPLLRGSSVCPALVAWTPAEMVDLLLQLLQETRGRDARLTIDSAEVAVSRSARAIASSTGIEGVWGATHAQGTIFGMAIDGDQVGSFAYDGDVSPTLDELQPALRTSFDRFVEQALGALAAGRGESFRGTILLPPSAIAELLLGPLSTAVSGRNVRLGKSPWTDRLGSAVAASALTFTEEGLGLTGHPLAPFDREGVPRARRHLIENGVLSSFVYDTYEARAAGATSTGSALGGSSSAPAVGLVATSIAPGVTPAAVLEAQQKCVVVTRFSGTADAISGDFSGVVKGGFLVDQGVRRPIQETTIAGNLYQCLQNISAVSSDTLTLYGQTTLPTLRIEDVSITAG